MSRHRVTCTRHHVRHQSNMHINGHVYHTDKKIQLFILRWYKAGKRLRSGEGLRIAANGRRLFISRAQISDSAHFLCLATNKAGVHERSFNVTVQGTKKKKNYNLKKTNNLDFCCYANVHMIIYILKSQYKLQESFDWVNMAHFYSFINFFNQFSLHMEF